MYHYEFLSSEDSNNSDDNYKPTHKSLSVNSPHSFVESSTAPVHRNDDKVSIQDEEEMNRNLKALQSESDSNNWQRWNWWRGSWWFNELAQELNMKEGFGEPVQQTMAIILETVWQNTQ